MKNYAVVKASTLLRKGENGAQPTTVPDKNGKEAVILIPQAGKIPFKRTLSGTIAQRQQIFDGGVYLVAWEEGPVDPENGRQYTFENMDTLKGLAIVDTIDKATKLYGVGGVLAEDEVIAEN